LFFGRFGLRLEVIDRKKLDDVRRATELGSNPFDHIPLGLVSVDFLKQERVLDQLERASYDVVVIDEGLDADDRSAGYLPRIAEQFHAVAARAIGHLDHPDCETACYRCLKSYYNQRYHEHLAWPQVMPALEELAAIAPQMRPYETGDIDDPRPWLEAYAAGVGSPLELKFLWLFERHGFHPQKQVPVAPNPGEAPISVADFAVPERRLAIYIDGAAFQLGQRLRRDRFVRNRLRAGDPPWQVEELRATDLGQGRALVERLEGA